MNKVSLLTFLFLIILFKTSYSQEEWTSFTNANLDIRALKFEGDFLWAGTSGGVVKWNVKDGSYVKYTAKDGLASNNVRSIAIDSYGNKWFGTWGGGVSKFDGTNWTTYGFYYNTVLSIAIDSDGNIWFGTRGGGVSMFDGTKWKTYRTYNGLVDNYVKSI